MLLKTAILFTVFSSGYLCQAMSFSTETWIYCAECLKQDITPVCGTLWLLNSKTFINLCFIACLNSKPWKLVEQAKNTCVGGCTNSQPIRIEIFYFDKCAYDNPEYQPVEDPGSIEDCSECDVDLPYPVCGSDNKTYENDCIFDCTSKVQKKQGIDLEKAYNGVCLSGLMDGDRYVPPTDIVIGWDDFTCRRPIRVPHRCTRCQQENTDWDPYCGSDNRTYGNECYLTCAVRYNAEQGKSGPHKAHSGSCDPAWNNYFTFFKNASEKFQGRDRSCSMADLTAVRVEGSTIEKADDTDCNDCDPYWTPVCGSDSLSYMNPCALECVSKVKSGLTKAHDGSCDPALDNYLDYFWYVSATLRGTYGYPIYV